MYYFPLSGEHEFEYLCLMSVESVIYQASQNIIRYNIPPPIAVANLGSHHQHQVDTEYEGVRVADVQVGMCVGSILHTRCMCWDHNTDEHGHEACILHTGHLGGHQHLALSSQHQHRQS